MSEPSRPPDLLTRQATAAALTREGFPISAATLATLASRGGGPDFSVFGRKALYSWEAALSWAQNRLAPSAAKGAGRQAA